MIKIGSTVFIPDVNAITNSGVHYKTYPIRVIRVEHIYYPKHRGPIVNGRFEVGKTCFEDECDCRQECELMNGASR